ncbi:MAG: GxxExxY protein [Candidatus Eiseniibacteriota bacterium]
MVEKVPIPAEIEAIGKAVVDSAFRVHTQLGAGLLEAVYEACLEHELRKRGAQVQRQVLIPVVYDGMQLDAGLRLDLLVDDAVIVEIKAVERTLPVFEAQLLTYLKLANKRLGFIVNFNFPLIRDGIKRMAL